MKSVSCKGISHKLSLSAHAKLQLRYNRPYEPSKYPNQEK